MTWNAGSNPISSGKNLIDFEIDRSTEEIKQQGPGAA
jgi:hypothetical protein